jgi:ribosomal protein S10
MGETYAEDYAEFMFFSADGKQAQSVADRASEICEARGAEYDGPIPLPRVTIESDDPAFSDGEPDAELFGQRPSDTEVERLRDESVARRIVKVYRDEEAVKRIARLEVPPDVFVRANLDTRTHSRGRREQPFTYDPGQDYNTEL